MFSIIEKATVTLIDRVGRGVLIKNNMILTASHCVNYDISGEIDLANGVNYIEEIITWSGKLKVQPLSIEAVSDIAVLGGLDDQECYSDYEQFEEFCRNTSPIKISRRKLELFKKFEIFIFTHEKTWISGCAYISFPESQILLLEPNEPIKPGTSGSGIFDEKGELVGIVIKTSLSENAGMASRPLLTLPVWVYRKIYNRH